MRFVSLFSGIGGLDLGLERAGHECVLQVEIDEFCQKVLAKHWPDVPRIADVHDVLSTNVPATDMLVGGFPCQPVSVAGKQLGTEDERWLWPEFKRIISVVRPRYILLENVPGLFVRGFSDVLNGLAALGYDAEWSTISAASVGAPHQRTRVFIVAYAGSTGLPRRFFEHGFPVAARESSTVIGDRDVECGGWWGENSADLSMGDGVPVRLARRYVGPLGNAVVPQVAELIGHRLMELERNDDH